MHESRIEIFCLRVSLSLYFISLNIFLINLSFSEGHDSKLSIFVPNENLNGVLSPNRPLHRQSIMPEESVYYRFDDLLPSFSYEVKLSYPATTPASFHMDLITSDGKDHNGGSRKLLNTEKLIFTTPKDSALFCSNTILRIRVFSEAVPWNRDLPPPRILFNVSIGGNFVGIPLECLPHIMWVVILLLFSPLLFRFVRLRIIAAYQSDVVSKQKP